MFKRVFTSRRSSLVLRLMGSDSLVSKDPASVGSREAPVNFQFGPIGPAVPSHGAAAQFAKGRYPLSAQALARPEAGLEFSGIEPAAVLRREVHGEALPQPVSRGSAEGLGE